MDRPETLADEFEFLVEQHIFGDLLALWTDQGRTDQEINDRAMISTCIMWADGTVRVH